MSPAPHTRRDALKSLGAGAAAFSCSPVARAAAGGVARPPARYFPLGDVRLGDGPFLDAQRRDADYLLRLEPDRMLHNFRVNAGLSPKAPVYGGWESQEPWVDIRCHGHTLGHYLTASSCMFASTGDSRFSDRVDYIVSELAECQKKTGGWLAAFPDGVAPLTESLAGRAFPGVPWYTTHKVLAGLRDAHLIRGSQPALDAWVSFSRWIDHTAGPMSDAGMQKMLDREHGGMNEVLADLAAVTGDRRFLALAQRFTHRALLEPLARGEDRLDGLHANTQIPKVIGFARIHDLTNEPSLRAGADFFWSSVVRTRSFATGGHGDGEHFFPVGEFARHLHSAKTMETCCTHNMMRLTRALYAQSPQATYFNYFERALYNGILASQDPDSGMMTYFQATRPGYVKLYHTPFDSFWCCTGSGIENHARYAESIYAHDDEALYVNLFMASRLEWRERGLTVTLETRFPDEETVLLKFDAKRPQSLKLRIRHPAWCRKLTTVWNAKGHASSEVPGSYYEIPGGRIRPGDRVELRLPMQARLEPLPGAPQFAALACGPIVLAARLGTQGIAPGSDLIVNERKSGEMLSEAVPIPAWPKPLEDLPASLVRTDESRLTFSSPGFAGGKAVEFIPWFRIAHERYNLYWQRAT